MSYITEGGVWWLNSSLISSRLLHVSAINKHPSHLGDS